METPPRPPASLRAPFAEPPQLMRRHGELRREEVLPPRVETPLTQSNIDGMLRVLEDRPSAAAVVNVFQDLSRYFDESGRQQLANMIRETREDYLDLSRPISERQLAIARMMVRQIGQRGGFRRRSQTARFNRCVKGVRKTVKPRPKSTAESAAIAICTKTLLHRRGRTLKKYRKGKRLMTQKRKD